jgi:hypothetical protein
MITEDEDAEEIIADTDQMLIRNERYLLAGEEELEVEDIIKINKCKTEEERIEKAKIRRKIKRRNRKYRLRHGGKNYAENNPNDILCPYLYDDPEEKSEQFWRSYEKVMEDMEFDDRQNVLDEIEMKSLTEKQIDELFRSDDGVPWTPEQNEFYRQQAERELWRPGPEMLKP